MKTFRTTSKFAIWIGLLLAGDALADGPVPSKDGLERSLLNCIASGFVDDCWHKALSGHFAPLVEGVGNSDRGQWGII